VSLLRDLIDEGVLADARKIDNFTRKYDPSQPSIENTLRLVRDVDTDALRRIGKDVWGVGGTEGADLVRTSFDKCVGELDRAVSQASAWTGQAKNAYGDRINQIKGGEGQSSGLHAMRSPVGQSLVAMGDAFDQIFGGTWADVFTIIGLVVAAIGVVVALIAGWTGVGAIIGLVVAIIGLIVSACGFYFSRQAVEENKIKSCEAASAAASKTLETASKTTL
jgi:hypothetical protein